MIDLTPMVQAVLSLTATVITVMVIPFIKSKLNANKLDELQKWAGIAVKAADQMFWGEGSGTDKKTYVTDFLKKKGYTINAEALETLIESEVQQLVRRPAAAPQAPQTAAGLPQITTEAPAAAEEIPQIFEEILQAASEPPPATEEARQKAPQIVMEIPLATAEDPAATIEIPLYPSDSPQPSEESPLAHPVTAPVPVDGPKTRPED